VVSEVGALLQNLGLFQYFASFEGYLVKSFDDIQCLKEDDWGNLKIPSFHKRKILDAVSLQPVHPNPTSPPNPVPKPSSQSQTSREDRRHDTPTARLQPGKRFLDLIPNAPTDKKHIIDSLFSWSNSKKLDTFIIKDMIAKIDDLIDEGNTEEIAISLSLCWLYTTESWVYKEMNLLLRNDAPSMEVLAPYMNGLIKAYQHLDDPKYFYGGIVYRRTRFIQDSDFNFYVPNKQFVWSAFTSTTTAFDPIGTFGDILFVITIPEKYKKYALNVQTVSDFKNEQEILLLPNIGYKVTRVQQGPMIEFQNSKVVIEIVVSYVCV